MASLELPPNGKAHPDGGLFGPNQSGALQIERYFTTEGIHPFNEVEWEAAMPASPRKTAK